jgi:hypothetical protein
VFERGEKQDRELQEALSRQKELAEKLRRKDEVLAELMEEHVRLKKTNGGTSGGNGSSTGSGTRPSIS